jgi:hypothetical protein
MLGHFHPAWYRGTAKKNPQEQFLPAKYKTQSELKMTIAPGSGTVEKDWELTSH